ncbi:MAG TPA: hypothetical protein ENN53_04555 [Candidatus Acetothermia bacterium]|nr:hypothetical protein [Candidatus Acetothermia bacterium]
MRPVSALFGDVQAWGKVHVGTTGPVSLATPFGVEILVPVPSWAVRAGWVLSWRALPSLTLHPGLDLGFVPATGILAYLGVDFDPWTNFKLILELDGEEPYLDIGLLAWLLGVVRFQVDVSLPGAGSPSA